MIVKTDPPVKEAEEKLSGYEISKELYKEALDILEEEGYIPKSVIIKRKSRPPFNIGIPLKIVADWDAQIEGADILFLLRETYGDKQS